MEVDGSLGGIGTRPPGTWGRWCSRRRRRHRYCSPFSARLGGCCGSRTEGLWKSLWLSWPCCESASDDGDDEEDCAAAVGDEGGGDDDDDWGRNEETREEARCPECDACASIPASGSRLGKHHSSVSDDPGCSLPVLNSSLPVPSPAMEDRGPLGGKTSECSGPGPTYPFAWQGILTGDSPGFPWCPSPERGDVTWSHLRRLLFEGDVFKFLVVGSLFFLKLYLQLVNCSSNRIE